MKVRHISIPMTLFVTVAVCGGGGGDAQAGPANQFPLLPLSALSYENRHTDYQYFDEYQLPGFQARWSDAHTFFQYKDGTRGFVFHRLSKHGPWNSTREQAEANPGQLHIWREGPDGNWVDISRTILRADSVPGCVHSRKILTSDFNQDGVVDFVVACQGWDGPPYPGERSRVVLSQADGTYKVDYLSSTISFQHTAASADLNGDGYPDLMMSSLNYAEIFINDKTGHFEKSSQNTAMKKAFHMELVDVTGDGKFDLLMGGHDWTDQARIIVNRGDNEFNGTLFSRPETITIPTVPGAGVICDFLYVKSINALYILRTGGSRERDPNFYKGAWVQKFHLTTKKSSIVYSNPGYLDHRGKPGWIRWILERDGYVVGDFNGIDLRVKVE